MRLLEYFRTFVGSRLTVRPDACFQSHRNAGGDFPAESEVLSARELGGLAVVEGRLRLHSGDRQRLLSDSLYLHVFRRRADGGWEMVAGAAPPVSGR